MVAEAGALARASSHVLGRLGSVATPSGALVLVGLVCGLLFVVAPAESLVRTAVYGLVRFLSLPALVVGFRRHRPPRPWSWALLGGGLAAATLGDVVFVVTGGGSATRAVLPSDVLYLASYVLMALGLGSLVERQATGLNRPALLDGVMVSVAVGAVGWVLLIEPATPAGRLTEALPLISLAYPLVDLALLAVLFRFLLTGAARAPAFGLLVFAGGALLASDVANLHQAILGGYEPLGWTDVGFILAPVALGAAALHPSVVLLVERRKGLGDIRLGRARLVLLGAAALLPMVLVAALADRMHEIDAYALAGAGSVLIGLVVARLAGAVSSLHAVLEVERRMEADLRDRALFDPLTGLANRHHFGEALGRTLEQERPAAVLFIDLDDFKTVNDTLGHEVGDALLGEVGSRLRCAVRPTDMVARLGGDEFGVLLLNPSGAAGAEAVARRILAALGPDVELAGRVLGIRASIGIAVAGPGATAASLLRESDIAMYLAKREGRNRYQVFETHMHGDVVEALELRRDLARALEHDEFRLHYQPIWTVPGRELKGFEALLRWDHPTRGLLGPASFIEAAEDTGLIVALGRWVLGEATRQLARWREAGPERDRLVVHVNVSARQLVTEGFASDVRTALEAADVPPARVLLELTESAFLEREIGANRLAELATLGVRLGIDDFGTGYSSLGCLAQLPIQVLKLDRRFVAGTGDERARGLVLARGVIAIARDLGLVTVAEGVETEEQLELAEAMGVDAVQGYLLGRPMSVAEADALLHATLGSGRMLPTG